MNRVQVFEEGLQCRGLCRTLLHRDQEPVALHPPVSVLDVAHTIHHELAESTLTGGWSATGSWSR